MLGISLGVCVVVNVCGESAFLKKLKLELEKRGNPWVAGETEFSKWYETLSEEEKDEFIRSISLTPTPKEFPPIEEGEPTKGKKLPLESFDWRNHEGEWWMTPVKHQWKCNSCWAHVFCAVLEARMNILTGRPNFNLDLSEQFIISCRTDGNIACATGNFYLAKAIFDHYGGAPDEQCYVYIIPQDADDDHPCEDRCSDWQKRLWTYSEFQQGPDNMSATQRKEWILEGPIGGAGYFKEDVFYYKGGIYYPILGRTFDHGVTFCGWHPDSGWLYKNSWGENWGDYGGYGWYGPGWGRPCRIVPYVPKLVLQKRYKIDDSQGNNNGEINRGEKIKLHVTIDWFAKKGVVVNNLVGTLSIDDQHITVTQSTSSFGNLTAPEKKEGNPAFEFEVKDEEITYPHKFECQITYKDGSGTTWERRIPLTIEGIPILWATDSLVFDISEKSLSPTGEDTLQYDDGQEVRWWRDYPYWGVKFTPKEECRVVGALIRRRTTGVEIDTVYLRTDFVTMPGNIVEKIPYTTQAGIHWYRQTFTTSPVFNQNFWICYYARTTSSSPDVSVAGDGGGGDRSYFSPNLVTGWSSLSQGNSDLLIRAIVTTGGVAKELEVKNIGTKKFVVSSIKTMLNSPWIINIEPTTFELNPGESMKVKVSVSTAGVTPNVAHKDTLVITSTALNKEHKVPVRLTVHKGVEEEWKRRGSEFRILKIRKDKVTMLYSSEKGRKVQIVAYDIGGRKVEVIVDKIKETTGEEIIEWKVKDLVNGVYFLKFETRGIEKIEKIILIK